MVLSLGPAALSAGSSLIRTLDSAHKSRGPHECAGSAAEREREDEEEDTHAEVSSRCIRNESRGAQRSVGARDRRETRLGMISRTQAVRLAADVGRHRSSSGVLPRLEPRGADPRDRLRQLAVLE